MDLKIFLDKDNKITLCLNEGETVVAQESWEDMRGLDMNLLPAIDRITKSVNIKITGIDKIDFSSKSPSFMANLICGVVVDNLRFAKNL